MIFNHNIVQRSDRILFDNGYIHEKIGGKFSWSYGGTDDNARPIIGETIKLYANPKADTEIISDSTVYKAKTIDLTNVNRINVQCECELWYTKGYTPYLNIGVFDKNANFGYYTDLGGIYSVKATKFEGSPNTSGLVANQNYLASLTKDAPITLDVSDLDGEYKFAISAVARPNKYVKPITTYIYRIWLE